jgi:hypothetical protein
LSPLPQPETANSAAMATQATVKRIRFSPREPVSEPHPSRITEKRMPIFGSKSCKIKGV